MNRRQKYFGVAESRYELGCRDVKFHVSTRIFTATHNLFYAAIMQRQYFLPFIVVAIALSISSCGSNPTSNNIEPSPTPSTPRLRTKPTKVEQLDNTPNSGKTTNVTVYISDAQCQNFIPQKVSVPAKEPVTGAVAKIIEARDSGDFSLSGYRVKVNNGVATVDLRLSPKSKRQLNSLSSCEQFALFGSLRKTLTSNAQWNIKEVRFTERGEEITL
jgi:Sporulation and spore germination